MTELVMWGQPASAGVADLPREGDGGKERHRKLVGPVQTRSTSSCPGPPCEDLLTVCNREMIHIRTS